MTLMLPPVQAPGLALACLAKPRRRRQVPARAQAQVLANGHGARATPEYESCGRHGRSLTPASPRGRGRTGARSRRDFHGKAVVLAVWCGAAVAGQVQGLDPDAGLPFWAWEEGPVEIRLVQRLPDQTRAFLIGRGFTSAAADLIGRSCVFQAIVRNRAPAEGAGAPGPGGDLAIDLATWRLEADAGPQDLPPKEGWEPSWEAMGESNAARIALRWSLFPSTQTFRPGDYNWGMIPFGVPPGTRFDLTLAWNLGGEPQGAILRGLVCAPEDVQ